MKSRISLVLSLAVSLNISAGGLSVFRSEPPDPFRVQVQPKSKNSFERLIEDTTSALIEPIKTVAQSLLPEGKLSDFLEFLLGYGSTQETAQKESEQLEAKVEAGLKLNSKEALKLELLRNEVSGFEDRADAYALPEGLLVVFAPGQELLKNLPEAIKQMAEEGGLSEAEIRSELEEIWNPKNYKDQKRLKKLRDLVASLFGRVIDLRHAKINTKEETQTYGRKIESDFSKSSLMPSTIVMGFLLLDHFLFNCEEKTNLDDYNTYCAMVGSLHVSRSLMCDECEIEASSSEEFSKCIWFVSGVLFIPGLICECISKAKQNFNSMALGKSVDLSFKPLSSKQNFEISSSPKRVGSGTHSIVLLSSCSKFAVKKLKFENNLPPQDFFRELLRPKCSHIHQIVNIRRSEGAVYLGGPYCQCGDLRKAVKEKKTQNPEIARKYLFQILQALAELEKNGVIHGDLKTQNVFLESEEKIVLGDFGLSCPNLPGIPDDEVLVTLGYRAPEVLFEIGPITPAIDVFAAGVIFWEMLIGTCFLAGEELDEKCPELMEVVFLEYVFGFPTEKEYPELFFAKKRYGDPSVWRNFISKEEQENLKKFWRIFVKEITPEAKELFNKMTKFDPARRIKASEALKHPYFRDLVSQDSSPSAQASAATAAASS